MTTRRAVLLVLVAAALVRLPFLAVLPGPDEAGLLLVGEQWAPGDSLYGDYWVDRPPVLVAWFRLAAGTGGVVALRLLGLLAVAATVVLCAATARRVAGERAGIWTAVTAGVLTVSPWVGADRVNAELLAAPWLALGVYSAIRAVAGDGRRWALCTGASVGAAVLTKQNQVDAAVFAIALLLGSCIAGRLSTRDALSFVAPAGAGAVAAASGVLVLSWTRGTDPGALLDALYPFRIRAGHALSAVADPHLTERRLELLGRSAASGQLVLALGVLLAPVRRRFRSPESAALSAMLLFACCSIAAGGSWWNHYLIELAVPTAVGAGLVAARTRIAVPVVVGCSAVSAVIGTFVVLPAVDSFDGPIAAGRMIADSAEPDDTVVNAWGRPDVVWQSGLTSPYEHLWSLPVRADDPRLDDFSEVVAGADAPVWLVTRSSLARWNLDADIAQTVVDRRYRSVATVCGYVLSLRNDVARPHPAVPDGVVCKPPTGLR